MLSRTQSSAGDSLAEALTRVIVTRQEADHRQTYEWATQEGRGDRMPRFLERAIEEVPHAARGDNRPGRGQRAEDRRQPMSRAAATLSALAVGVGIGISMAGPTGLGPMAQRLLASTSFATQANAATPRMAFGQALRTYSEKAVAEAAGAHVMVRNVAPGTTLSAGSRVSDSEWSVAQSELDNLVITFPQRSGSDAVQASVEIPATARPADGTFNVELRQASEAVAAEAAGSSPSAAAEAPSSATPVVSESPTTEAPNEDVAPASTSTKPAASAIRTPGVKKKSRPSAANMPKKPTITVADKAGAAVRAVASAKVAATPEAIGGGGLGSLFQMPTFSLNNFTPNQLTLFSLGGPVSE